MPKERLGMVFLRHCPYIAGLHSLGFIAGLFILRLLGSIAALKKNMMTSLTLDIVRIYTRIEHSRALSAIIPAQWVGGSIPIRK